MRRKDREVTDFNEIEKIISECDTIRIGLQDGMYPYIVPLSFGYEVKDGKIDFYIHGALAGRKYELMKKNGVCSFEMDCAHMLDLVYEKKDATMRYKCIMGAADITLLDGEERQKAIDIIMDRHEETRNFEYNRAVVARTMTARLSVTQISAKVNPPGGGAD